MWVHLLVIGTYDNVSCMSLLRASLSELNFTSNVKNHGLPFISDTMLFSKRQSRKPFDRYDKAT
jgi:hypothetical protein